MLRSLQEIEMIFSTLTEDNEEELLSKLGPIFDFLRLPSTASLEPDRYSLFGDDVYALVQRTKTRAFAEGKFEAHQQYLDVQFLVDGTEVMGVASASSLKVSEAYDETKDVVFFETPAIFSTLSLSPGMFTLFMPRDAHLPSCHDSEPTEIKKIVVKVRLQWLAAR
jgi:biofilm protein TabA